MPNQETVFQDFIMVGFVIEACNESKLPRGPIGLAQLGFPPKRIGPFQMKSSFNDQTSHLIIGKKGWPFPSNLLFLSGAY